MPHEMLITASQATATPPDAQNVAKSHSPASTGNHIVSSDPSTKTGHEGLGIQVAPNSTSGKDPRIQSPDATSARKRRRLEVAETILSEDKRSSAQAPGTPVHLTDPSQLDPNLASYLHTMQLAMHHSSHNMSSSGAKPSTHVETAPAKMSAYHQGLQLRRDKFYQQALLDSILSSSLVDSSLRSSIAEEIKARIGCLLSSQDRHPKHITTALMARGKLYWAHVHQIYHQISAQHLSSWLDNQHGILYAQEDMDRALYFWATHHKTMSYGEIAFELRLPPKLLLSQIMQFANPK